MPDHQESTVTATPLPLASPRTAAEAHKTGPDDLAAELNPHETELNPHEAVPGRLAVPERIKKWRLSAHGAELTSTQPTGAGPAVTPPAIRGTRDAPPPPLAELAHAYPMLLCFVKVVLSWKSGGCAFC
jgi:hypothetical protein